MSVGLQIRNAAIPVALMVASAFGVARVRAGLVETVTKVRDTSAIYPLPPPEQLPVASLGYRAALADVLWASVMVNQGLAIKQHRRYDYAARYFESIFELDPTYRQPYLLVETILTFGTFKATAQDAHDARRILERGMRERPNDAQLFHHAGSFMAYLAPSMLPEEERAEWRRQGAFLMARAGELGGADTNLQWQALGSATALTRAGERQAAIDFLRRIYEITEDAELRQDVLRRLQGLQGEEAVDRARSRVERFEAAWRGEFSFVSRTQMLLLGPSRDGSACAGPGHSTEPACAWDWNGWNESPGR